MMLLLFLGLKACNAHVQAVDADSLFIDTVSTFDARHIILREDKPTEQKLARSRRAEKFMKTDVMRKCPDEPCFI